MTENNEIMSVSRDDIAPVSMMDSLTDPTNSFYCSIQNDGSRESAIKVYNAVNSKGESLTEQVGKVLEIVDIAAHPVNLTDENTGEQVEGLRVVMIDKNGKIYDAVSNGIVNSLQRIFAMPGIGQPTYNPPLKMKVMSLKTRKGRITNTLELVF